ncbi:MAG: hypothetical protein AAGJ35_07020, partial [Myxococcota bacterium]
MKLVSFGLATALVLLGAGSVQADPSIKDCFGIDTDYDSDDERAGALLNCVEALATDLIPAGAVMAFDRTSGCPDGWSEFTAGSGRMIVGVGKRVGVDGSFKLWADSDGSVYETGGAETHKLTVSQMPRHGHRISTDDGREFIHDG